jgi:hypothetical protein
MAIEDNRTINTAQIFKDIDTCQISSSLTPGLQQYMNGSEQPYLSKITSQGYSYVHSQEGFCSSIQIATHAFILVLTVHQRLSSSSLDTAFLGDYWHLLGLDCYPIYEERHSQHGRMVPQVWCPDSKSDVNGMQVSTPYHRQLTA